jgi:hypothetical protein
LFEIAFVINGRPRGRHNWNCVFPALTSTDRNLTFVKRCRLMRCENSFRCQRVENRISIISERGPAIQDHFDDISARSVSFGNLILVWRVALADDKMKGEIHPTSYTPPVHGANDGESGTENTSIEEHFA